jgi:hypothetical protein
MFCQQYAHPYPYHSFIFDDSNLHLVGAGYAVRYVYRVCTVWQHLFLARSHLQSLLAVLSISSSLLFLRRFLSFFLSLFLSFLLSFFLSSPSSKGKLDKAIEVFSTLLLYRTDLPAAHLGTGEHSARLCHAAQHYLRRLRAFPLNHYYLLENHFLWSSLFLLLTRLCFLAVNNTAVT